MQFLPDNVLLFLWLLGLIGCIWIKTKFDLNFGIAALACAYVVGCLLKGLTPSSLINNWPLSVLFVFLSTGLFFGFAAVNGTLKLLSEKMLYATRNASWFPPIALFLIAFVISTLGAGPISTNLFIPPIGYAIAIQAGFNPLLVSVGVCLGAAIGNTMPWASGFHTRAAYLTEDIVAPELQYSMGIGMAIQMAIVYTIIFMIFYFALRGYKSKGSLKGDVMEKPAPFNDVQKKTLVLIGIVVTLVIIPVVLKTIMPDNAFAKWGSTFIYLQFLCVVFAVIANFMKLGDFKQVCSRIPWMTMVQAGGASIYVKVAIELGLADVVTSFVQAAALPGWAVIGIVFLFSALLSFFSGYYTIMPLMLGMAASVCAACGATTFAFANATYLGCMLTAFSPFSTCGAMQLAGCMDDEVREKMFMPQFYVCIIAMLIGTVIACTPLLNMFFSG